MDADCVVEAIARRDFGRGAAVRQIRANRENPADARLLGPGQHGLAVRVEGWVVNVGMRVEHHGTPIVA